MKKPVLSLAVAAAAIVAFGGPQPAEAGVRWLAGAEFDVGGVHFTIGFHPPHRYVHDLRPDYYYRTRAPLRYPGVRCTSVCTVRDAYRYHAPRCPVVHRHFSRHRFDPYPAWRFVHSNWFGYDRGYYHRDWRRDRRWDRRYGYDRDRWYRDRHRHRRWRCDHPSHRHDRYRDRYDRRWDDGDSDSDSDSDRRRRYRRRWRD